jgi:hypothetical protein
MHFGYGPMFVIMGSFHLIGLAWVHLFMGNMTPVVEPQRVSV